MEKVYERIREVFGGVENMVDLVGRLARRACDEVIFPHISDYLRTTLVDLSRRTKGEKRRDFTFKFNLRRETLTPSVTDPEKVDYLLENLNKLVVVVRVKCEVIRRAVNPLYVLVEEGWFSVSKSLEPMIEVIISCKVVSGTPPETVVRELEKILLEKKKNLLNVLVHELVHFLDVTFGLTVKRFPKYSPDVGEGGQSRWMEFLKRLIKVFHFLISTVRWKLFDRREIWEAEKFAIEMSELTRTLNTVLPSEVKRIVREIYRMVSEGRDNEIPREVRRVLNKFLWELIVNFRDALTRLGYKGDSLRAAKREVASLFGLTVDELQTLLDLQDRVTGS